jgi:uncharacterized cupin superfamily protein
MPLDVFGDDWDLEQRQPGFRWRRLRLGRRLGARELGASVFLLPPGERTFPLHFHHGNEEMLIVLDGVVTVRTPEGEQDLGRGEAMVFLRGPGGAHQCLNRGERECRLLVLSTMHAPDITHFPDTGKFGLFAGAAPGGSAEADLKAFVSGSTVDYFADEPIE